MNSCWNFKVPYLRKPNNVELLKPWNTSLCSSLHLPDISRIFRDEGIAYDALNSYTIQGQMVRSVTYLSIYLSIYPSIHPSIYGSTALLLDLGHFFSFLTFYTVCSTPLTGDQPVERPLPAHGIAKTQNKRTQTCMPRVGFELTILVFEWAKTVHALDRAATVIG
jgi:hypothetical protein